MTRYHLLAGRVKCFQTLSLTSVHTWGTRNTFCKLTWKMFGSKECFSVSGRILSVLQLYLHSQLHCFPFFLLCHSRTAMCTRELHPTMQTWDSKLYKRAVCPYLSPGNLTEDKSHTAAKCHVVWKPCKQWVISSLMDDAFGAKKTTLTLETRMLKFLKNEVNQPYTVVDKIGPNNDDDADIQIAYRKN